jgi:hypothetical protein
LSARRRRPATDRFLFGCELGTVQRPFSFILETRLRLARPLDRKSLDLESVSQVTLTSSLVVGVDVALRGNAIQGIGIDPTLAGSFGSWRLSLRDSNADLPTIIIMQRLTRRICRRREQQQLTTLGTTTSDGGTPQRINS